jgi:ferredoxin
MTEFAIGTVMLVLIVILSSLYERVFCKYLCPLGAVNAILGRIPLFRIRRKKETCVSCAKCDRVCPMNVEVSTANEVNSAECIGCMECVTSCPAEKGTLETTLAGKSVKPATVVVIGFAIFLAAAIVGQATGMLRFVAPTLQSMADKGTLKVEDIKGSSTYESVAESFGIEPERLYREAGIDMKVVPPSTMIKDTSKVAGIEGFETDTVRVAVAKILGVPYSGEGEKAGLSGEKVPEPAAVSAPREVSAQPDAAFTVPEDFELEGTMTIAEAAKVLGTTDAAIVKKLGLPADAPTDKPLRNMKDQYGYTMPALKEKIRQ